MTLENRVEGLRREFDRSFSLPHRDQQRDFEDFIAVRVAGDPYVLRLGDIAALAARRAVVPLPSRRREFLGLAGHRGSLAALFSLPMLLGYGAPAALPRWFALLRAGGAIALGFDEYDGFARVAGSEIYPVGDAARREFVTQAAQHAGIVRLIVDIPGVVNVLTRTLSERK